MTEDELRRYTLQVANVRRLENLARDVAQRISPTLREAFNSIVQRVLRLPEGSIEREMAYKQMQGFMDNIFQLPVIKMQTELTDELIREAPEQLYYAGRYVELDPGEFTPSAMRIAQATTVERTRVLDRTIEELMPGLERQYIKAVDKAVKEGFLKGLSVPQVARNVAAAYKPVTSQNLAIIRTAMFEMSQQALFAMVDANPDNIAYWKFDATFDYKVCEDCAYLDGLRRQDRNDFPYPHDARNGKFGTRVHPNCRCQILPITNAQAERDEKEPIDRRMKMLVPKPGTDSYTEYQGLLANATAVRRYKTPKRVRVGTKTLKDGRVVPRYEKRYEVVMEFGKRMEMSDMIAQAPFEMQAQILGSKKEAMRYRKYLLRRDKDNELLGNRRALADMTAPNRKAK